MKYYKNSKNQIFGFEIDGSQDNLITEDLIQITLDDVNIINKKNQEEIFSNLTYQQKRQSEYPSIYDYLDGIVKNDQNQINNYIDTCKAVKNKYPKP